MGVFLYMLKAIVDGVEHPIGDATSKLHLVFKSPQASLSSVEYSDDDTKGIVLDYDATSYHADRVTKLHEKTEEEVRKIFKDFTWPLPKPMPSGVKFIVGLIDLSYKLVDLKVQAPIVWKYPEAFLHPAEVVELADVALTFKKYAQHGQ